MIIALRLNLLNLIRKHIKISVTKTTPSIQKASEEFGADYGVFITVH